MLEQVYVKKFRKLENLDFKIASRLTLISGVNGIGKSTLLGIIANGSGTKTFKTLNNELFHPDFRNYFILNKNEHRDARKSNDYYEVVLKYLYASNDVFKRVRTSHPNQQKLKLVPRTVDNQNKESDQNTEFIEKSTGITGSGRIPLPTYYLSLSRLYPFGETNITDANIKKVGQRKNINDQEALVNKYIEMYNKVLPRSIDLQNTDLYDTLKPNINTSNFYIELNSSSIITQSVGQDSLSGIINSLLNFYNIKDEQNYKGGILCIDEIDVSLHPDAQLRLLRLLKECAEELNLQVIFTSHSLTIIQEMIKLSTRDEKKYSILYLKNNSRPYLSTQNLFSQIKADLYSKTQYSAPKVKVYLEDDEARFVMFQLINDYLKKYPITHNPLLNCEIISSQIGCKTLLQLPEKDSYFKSIIIVLDGDAKYKNKLKLSEYLDSDPQGLHPISNIPKNIICLPDDFSPEEIVFRALFRLANNENDYSDFWDFVESNETLGNYYPQVILNELEDMINSNHIDRVFLKDWFKTHKSFFDQSQIYPYYFNRVKKTNTDEFCQKLITLIKLKLTQLQSRSF
ncbi:AAA family ATPase [Sporolactobacillus terrae]|uniref:AAA family ATPase n=1 Tax=Sporolactobacillus terrae TaxID=269673 RepID=UPI00048E169E|nr:AAA family ATPase [Sporolactobacillus terrae]